MSGNDVEKRSAAYWDENREKSRDPGFWMAHPICRAAINRRVTGDPNKWPLDWFRENWGSPSLLRGVSWGCGLGALERALVGGGVVTEIDAFDISRASVEDARRQATREGICGVRYALGNFNDPHIEPARYDVAFFHQSLHHVSALERLFRRLAFALKPRALVYAEEYVGPSRHEWRREDLGLAQALLDVLPPEARISGTVELPIEEKDPSEAVRSSEVPRFLREFLDVLAWRNYGGQLVDLIFPLVVGAWTVTEPGRRWVKAMLDIEDYELRTRPASGHHLVVVGRLKPLSRLCPPLARQSVAAARRRADRLLARVSS